MASIEVEQVITDMVDSLSDYEFEMLVRKRIAARRDAAVLQLESSGIPISDYYKTITFVYNNSGGVWTVNLGKSYEDSLTERGEVLSITMKNAVEANFRRHDNKLSLLLPVYTPATAAQDQDQVQLVEEEVQDAERGPLEGDEIDLMRHPV